MKRLSKSALVSFGLLLVLAPAARAGDRAQMDRARDWLTDANTGKVALGFLRFGCTNKGVQCLNEYNRVTDASNRVQAGHFALKIRYNWTGLDNGNDYTDVMYFFNERGRITSFRIEATTATLIKEFAAADLVVEVARQIIRDLVKNNSDATLRNTVEQIVRTANASRLMMLYLELSQP